MMGWCRVGGGTLNLVSLYKQGFAKEKECWGGQFLV